MDDNPIQEPLPHQPQHTNLQRFSAYGKQRQMNKYKELSDMSYSRFVLNCVLTGD